MKEREGELKEEMESVLQKVPRNHNHPDISMDLNHTDISGPESPRLKPYIFDFSLCQVAEERGREQAEYEAKRKDIEERLAKTSEIEKSMGASIADKVLEQHEAARLIRTPHTSFKYERLLKSLAPGKSRNSV